MLCSVSGANVSACNQMYLIVTDNKSHTDKVIIDKLCGEVFLVEQDTIEHVSAASLRYTSIFLRKNIYFFHLYFMDLFNADATIFKKIINSFAYENMKKNRPQKLLIIRPNIFQYCQLAQTQPKSRFVFHRVTYV